MIDRLMEKIEALSNPSVAGLDPTYEMIPPRIREEMFQRFGKTPKAVAQMFVAFNRELIDALWDVVPAVKPQIAMYEAYGVDGIAAYTQTIQYAKEKGMLVIGDIKRGDIASTAAAYAAHLEGVTIEGEYYDLWQEDAVTLNPYLGFDSLQPFIEPCNRRDKGVFMLVKTSNPSGGQVQDLGEFGEKTYEHVAGLVSAWGKLAMGEKGYSKIGAVVGATYPAQGKILRALMPNTFFLVPGYGAQGGTSWDLKRFFDRNGGGCIINSSRGIIAAYQKNEKYTQEHVGEAAREAAIQMREDLRF